MTYQQQISTARQLIGGQATWTGIDAEAVARMRLQNRFRTGLDIARYTAAIMRRDMAAYDADPVRRDPLRAEPPRDADRPRDDR